MGTYPNRCVYVCMCVCICLQIIHAKAGPRLRKECREVMQPNYQQKKYEDTGLAKITKGYCLPSSHVLHTVGPIIGAEGVHREQQELLANCYTNCLETAKENKLRYDAF